MVYWATFGEVVMTMATEWLFGGMALIVLVLVAVTARLWWKVDQQNKAQRRLQDEQQQRQAKVEQDRIQYIYESINVISRAVLDDQCPVIEGCIRMAVLMDNLSLDCDTKHRFSPLFTIYNATRHIPTHSNWKSLERRQQQSFKQEMFALEREHGEVVKELMAYVRDNPFGVRLGNSVN